MRRSKVHFDFSNFSCIVTGGTKGIGYEIADLLGRSGAHIGVCARNQNDLAHVVSEFTAKGYHFTTYRCDLTDSDAIKPMVDFFVDEFGGTIDGLVNNAGMNILESMGELRAEAVKQVIGLNLVAPILVTNAVVPYMKKESFGRIVNIASLSSVTGFYDHTAYCASKAGILGYMQTAAVELGKWNITVNSVGPTVVLTELGKEAWDTDVDKRKRMEAMIPLGRFLEVEDVAPSVVYLLSDAASMISGQLLLIDGGYMTGKGI